MEGNKIHLTGSKGDTKDVDIEKQDSVKKQLDIINNEEDEPLEKAKEKPPPGINGSLIMLYGLFLIMFAMGWIALNSCSINRLIPIYLIIAGFVGALAKFLSKIGNPYTFNLTIILVICYIIWTLLGTYWVYREYQPNYDYTLGKYCNRTAYLLAFWVLTFQYTLLTLFILLAGCYLLMRGDFKKK
ncbi:transmembrane protein 272-like isoform X2 [Aethina tumida]|uniref:transmembrane protein 272-like isoform X2 n=1 Tax=Aethina tumida TaxID=116153 RepID=UPI002147A2CB|nr:transmembrane protein 272-like isoform X2 [Aethina tumida]